MRRADLHLHTLHSDGTYTPGELVSEAVRHGLSMVALTDHDTVAGCAEVAAEAERAGIGFITGTEVTVEWGGRELHVLGYLVDAGHPGLARALESAQAIRQDRIREMVARLKERSVPIELENVFAVSQCRAPGRPHLARALVAAGVCGSLDEAFERYLKKDRPGWVPKAKMPAAEAIDLIHAAGGLAVLAHPGLNHDDGIVRQLAALGIDGVECFHPKHGPSASRRYQAMAGELGLLVTGGSDCHGRRGNRPTMGTVTIPVSLVEALVERCRQRGGRNAANHA